ncbi:hypothetical protein [Nocardia vaccinii]|uniref:hypothetical protein n=1 Tax=Nocardia vaccinii TaxID=1822 RepID=UPI00082E8C21|nr:hypothetical protein [Nocardia vaccinii]
MSEHGTWEELVVGLCDLAVKYDAETYLRESVVLLSARSTEHGTDSSTVRVTLFDDEAARVEAGWCLNMVVDYVAEDRDRPAPVLGLVEAICSGNAEEHCLIDSNGQWVGVFFDAWSETGDRWQAGSLDSPEKRAVRRFPKWTTAR